MQPSIKDAGVPRFDMRRSMRSVSPVVNGRSILVGGGILHEVLHLEF
jgi:hypothetical protein